MVDKLLNNKNMQISGIQQSKEITNNVVCSAVNLFNKHFDKKKYSLFSWGSVARREMGPFSDLDLIILSEKPDKIKIEKFRKDLQNSLPSHRLDILEVFREKELLRLAQIDGTDRQALLFLRKEEGFYNPKISSNIRRDSRGNLREIFHICSNLEFVYPKLYDDRNIKFGEGRIKYYCFVHLLANYLKSDFQIYDTQESFKYLSDNKYLSEEMHEKAIENFDFILLVRNKIQEIVGKETYKLEDEALDVLCKDMKMNKDDLLLLLNENKSFCLALYQVLKGICIDIAKNKLNKVDTSYLKDLLINRKEPDFLGDNIKERDEIIKVVVTSSTKESNLLDYLIKEHRDNWYISHGIANNINAQEETLWKLIVPDSNEDKKIMELYTDFAWRNIYLYIAKNPAAKKNIREYICNYPNARPMDIKAASKGL
jgi:predicted nucleotidyltransferase